ncbi:DNA translocase FtsK [Coraliomargarita algicola]|uniref:DNA translocase FtsK n=1 Tax=Coraliomargarita algicola TaxID=3092156 RepID=A0ABZ0RD89_9BACT|nr:DNA translocase FtsK [Coraliomargarita sp. J2-16]WPJ94124.1 DNA translocase FtsK [Coraliomargarita sp. J2-16]
MALPFSRKKSSLRLMKAGISRLVDTIEAMKESVAGADEEEEEIEYEWVEYEVDDNHVLEDDEVLAEDLVDSDEIDEDGADQTFEEDEDDALPDTIASEAEKEQAVMAAEAAELATWRTELDALLKDREERSAYFKTYLSDSEARFQRMLANTRAQLAGEDPRSREIAEEAAKVAAEDALAAEAAPEPEPIVQPVDLSEYQVPTIELLDKPNISSVTLVTPEALEAQKNALQDAIDSFAVDAHVYDALIGPRITQFRVQPGMGVRVESIVALQKNIALALATTNIRMQAPIPGEPFVGIEIGNSNSVPIALRTLLQSKAWRDCDYEIPLIMGLDIQGKPIITDLAKAPHLLIAGATGSGKSVCMSTLILSMLYKFKPDELELVLIDPKRVEFGLFRQVPHLIHSVVADAKPAVQVLKWVVAEMERRYEVLAEKQVRNIAGYNEKAAAEGFKKMPFTVVIIDELADLMMTSKGDAEGALARIAQLSRAVGIHTIVATQRPSVNVITGIIKANFPTRIAFQVSSNVDSRTILDCKGAESLLGRGDFLFNPPGIARLIRIQSPMVEDHEIIQVVEHISGQRLPEFRVDLSTVAPVDQGGTQMGIESIEGEDDEALLKKAMLTVAESQKASTSFLQRRLRIGYNRAALLMEELEDRMHVGPQNGSTPREVFITPEEVEWCKK